MRRLTRFLSALMSGVMLASSGICLPLQHITASAGDGDFSIDWDYEANHNISSPEDALIYEAGKKLVTSETTSDVSNYLKDHYNEYKWTHVKSWNTFDGDTKPKKPGTGEYWSPDNYKIENPLRDALKDPDIKYIALYDDDEHQVHARGTWQPMQITSDKVLDLNGHTLNIRYNKNRNNSDSDRYQKDNEEDLNCTAFEISNGATLTIIDSSAWRGEGPDGNGTGTIKFNAYMINPYSYDIKHYTVRDLFHVSDGNLVIYGGTFEAGRAKTQIDDGFKLDKLKSVVGSVISLGVAVTEYATGINLAAKGKYQDARDLLEKALKQESAAEAQGKTGEDDGTSGTPAIEPRNGKNETEVKLAGEETKKDAPAGKETRDQTIDEKKKAQNEKVASGKKPGNEEDKNKANEQNTAKNDKYEKLATAENDIVKAAADKDKLGTIVDGCFDVVDHFVDLLGLKSKEKSRVTQSIMGTVVRVGLKGSFVAYGGTFKGYGSTPNTRNAVVEVTVNLSSRQDWDKNKYTGGLAYIYGGTFEAYTGANVFNFVRSNTNTQQAAQSVKDQYGNISTQLINLSKEETTGVEILFYENQDAVKAGANVAPIPISTANVQVRGGLFRCFYDAINVAIRESGDDQHFRIFPGTMGSVNLGVNSFNEQLIQDGRIQINDIYGDGALVLMDSREDEANKFVGLYHYRLYCGDTELRYKSYLSVYPNNDPAIHASRSMQLSSFIDENRMTSEVYTTDEDGSNIRAPYRETEYYFDCVIDNDVFQHYKIAPNFFNAATSSMTDWQGANLRGSEVWYYPTPMSAREYKVSNGVKLAVPIEDTAIGNAYLDTVSNDTYLGIPQRDLKDDEDWKDLANCFDAGELKAIQKSSSSIRTDMQYYTYKIYRVDPLTRDNIPESGIYNDDSPLFTVRYGTCDDSLKCSMSMTELENRIGMAKGYASGAWHFSAGEMYRVTLEVEERVGIGYGFTNDDYPKYCAFAAELEPAKVRSSVLFRCCSQKDSKDTDYNLNDEKAFSPLRVTNAKLDTEKDDQGYDKNVYTIAPGTYADVQLINGKAGMVDYIAAGKLFDVYYQWIEVDEDGFPISGDCDESIIAGINNIYDREKSKTIQRSDFIPPNWHPGQDGYVYRNTVDPEDPKASTYHADSGLPTNKEKWEAEQIHAYLHQWYDNDKLKANSDSLAINNNDVFASNTDTCYIPESMAGKYFRVRAIVTNLKWNQVFDEKQTFYSQVVRVGDASSTGSTGSTPKKVSVYKIGGTQEFKTEKYCLLDDKTNTKFHLANIDYVLKYIGYDNSTKQYKFMFDENISWSADHEFKVSASNSGTPWGLQIIGGSGIETNPYRFKVLFSDPKPEQATIVGQPSDVRAGLGETATIRLYASGNGLSYQWQYQMLGKWIDCEESGSKTSTLNVPVTRDKDSRRYRCVVTSSNGTNVVSREVKLELVSSYAEMIHQFGKSFVVNGDEEWYLVDDQDEYEDSGYLYDSHGDYSLTYGGYLTSTGQYYFDYGTLRVYVTAENKGKPWGVAINAGQGTWNQPYRFQLLFAEPSQPVIKEQPLDVHVLEGHEAYFRAMPLETQGITYQWQYYNGSAWVNLTDSRAKKPMYSVTVTKELDGRQYRSVLTRNNQTVISAPATLYVEHPAEDKIIQMGKDVSFPADTYFVDDDRTINRDSNAVIKLSGNVSFTSASVLYDDWRRQYQINVDSRRIKVTAQDEGNLWGLAIISGDGSKSDPYRFMVLYDNPFYAPTITAQPEDFYGASDGTASFSVTASGRDLSYQWYYKDITGSTVALDDNAATITVPITADMDGSTFWCKVQSAGAMTTDTEKAVLHVVSAPVILSQPEDYAGLLRDTAEFHVIAKGPGMTYQWQTRTTSGWEDVNMTGSRSHTLKVPITEDNDGAEFRCVVSAKGMSFTTSASAKIIVTGMPATITAQPSNYAGAIGETATFSVQAIGTVTLAYHWLYLDSNGVWQPSGMPGADTATLSVEITEARNGQQYCCLVAADDGPFALSDPAKIIVDKAAPFIAAHPQDYSGAIGEVAKFTVNATGGNLTYQWQFLANTGWQNSGMTGSKTATLSVPITEARNGQQYRCIVTGKGKSLTSSAAAIHIKPTITAQPKNFSGEVGATAKFTVSATGANLTYQWQFLDNGAWKNSGMTGSKTATLSVPVTAARNGQQYRCVVSSNGISTNSDAAKIIVTASAPVISAQPKDYTGAVGETAKFTVTATGTGTLSYQWQFLSTSGWKDSGMDGAKTNTLNVGVTDARNGQQYRCVVKSSNGTSVTSNAAKITVKTNPLTITAQPKDYTGAINDTAKFTVTASGTNLTYQWQFLDNGAWKNSGMNGTKTNTLSVQVTAARNGQQYRCVVSSNGTSVNSNPAKIIVAASALAISAQPSNYTGAVGETAKFTVSATGTSLSYQWQYLDKADNKWKNSGLTGALTNTLTVPVTAARDGLHFHCIVKSSNGSSVTSNTAKLTVKPTITAQPKDYSGAVDTTAKFTVTASGTSLSYQWQFLSTSGWKDSGMDGAKTSTLSVPITEARNGQKYRCIVKSANGTSVTSNAAALNVTAGITGQPESVSAPVGETAQFTVTAPNATYQWQFLATTGWQNSGMTGAKTATISVPVTEARDGQKYRCIVKLANGTTVTSDEVTLTVQAAITAQPQNFTAKAGETAKFTVSASGTGLTYQWQFLSSTGWQNSGMTGAQTATISVPATAARNGQQYRCIVTSANGTTVTSDAAKLTVAG